MQSQNWVVCENGYDPSKIEFLGSKFTIGNGNFGIRGTLEEFRRPQLPACTVSEVYDDNGSGWREIVNAPNVLFTEAEADGTPLNVLQTPPTAHRQEVCLQNGLHRRRTTFRTNSGAAVTVEAERFTGIVDARLLAMKYTLTADQPVDFTITTGFDEDIWDLNGPHFRRADYTGADGCLLFDGETTEKGYRLALAARIVPFGGAQCVPGVPRCRLSGRLIPGEAAGFVTYAALEKLTADPAPAALALAAAAADRGWDALHTAENAAWAARWKNFDVEITGDDAAQLALRHSIFLLMTAAPFDAKDIALPARGLSGQVYKGAMFWDTELYFLPMFLHTAPGVARSLVNYRVKNLAGALKKAAEEGYEGAFYPWESQETGQEGCTYYNLTDIFTGRPVRTYFRDKQIHISAAAAHGILAYARATGDRSLLAEGGAAVLLECVKFFWSYAYYKATKQRYELLDVTGPDEYHERVNNNAYTNALVRETAEGALWAVEQLRTDAAAWASLCRAVPDWEEVCAHARELRDKIYLPAPRADGVIEQYDDFFKQEDCSLETLRSRIINPNEYLGSPTGLSVNTQIAKQADIVLLLTVLGGQYTDAVKLANWEYYEPRCEHGSSLSTCVYALLAAQLGKTDWAYRYFMKAASLDLSGGYKLYLGPLYIGGTHPAANGGSWMVAVQGFGGLRLESERAVFQPHLPESFARLRYRFTAHGAWYTVTVEPGRLTVAADDTNTASLVVACGGAERNCAAGQTVTFAL